MKTDQASAKNAAERLRKSVQDHPLSLPDGSALQVTISIGIADAALSMSSFEALLKRADEALYEAKRTGRNKVVRAPQVITDVTYQAAAE